ncbi:MAG: hypothetical protein QOJ57_392 [Thermoleophilaceae bacterium]|jgi:uncharacterized membrane protein|nr:hypothetical protein [Thermoleophilaceae bacterium]
MRALVAAGFIASGILHFTHRRAYERIMPPYIPLHTESVLVSGAAEIAGGAAVLARPSRRVARWWLLALLAAVFPANVHMALNPRDFKQVPAWALWLRLPFQGVFAWSVWRATEPD